MVDIDTILEGPTPDLFYIAGNPCDQTPSPLQEAHSARRHSSATTPGQVCLGTEFLQSLNVYEPVVGLVPIDQVHLISDWWFYGSKME